MLRIARIVGAYAASILAGMGALAVLFGLASFMPSAPGYWTLTAVSPVVMIGAPVVGIFLAILAVVVTGVPILLLISLTEMLKWRAWGIYVCMFALGAGGLYLTLSFRTISGLDAIGLIEAGLFAVAGGLAGATYWLIAGRSAGAWR